MGYTTFLVCLAINLNDCSIYVLTSRKSQCEKPTCTHDRAFTRLFEKLSVYFVVFIGVHKNKFYGVYSSVER